MQPSPGHNCFRILLGGSKHSPALPLSLALLGRKIFQRAGQHPGQRQALCQRPRASPCTPLPPKAPAEARASSAKKRHMLLTNPKKKTNSSVKILFHRPLPVPPATPSTAPEWPIQCLTTPSLLYTFDYAPLPHQKAHLLTITYSNPTHS